MCINFNGYHSGGSSFLNVNDCWEKKKKSPSIWFRTPKPVRIRKSGRTGIGGVTITHKAKDNECHENANKLISGIVMIYYLLLKCQ